MEQQGRVAEPGQQEQQQQQWQPEMTEPALARIMDSYDRSPSRFSNEDVDRIKKHAEFYGKTFYEGEFQLTEAIKQFGGGFIEGFTTLHVSDEPDNEYEAIARNIGHLSGFVPGMLAKPLNVIGKALQAKSLVHAASKLGAVKSLPILVADRVTKETSKIFSRAAKASTVSRTGAVKEVSDFFLGNKAKHIVEGAFHLGVASGVSSWQGGVDEMVQGFIGGAQAGGVFRLIGNHLKMDNPMGTKLARGLAGSLFMGLPSSIQGATTPEQVYEYLMGAYFGSNEVSWARARARKELVKIEKTKEEGMEDYVATLRDPSTMEGYDLLPEQVKPILKEEIAKRYGKDAENLHAGYELSKLTGQLWQVDKKTKKIAGMKTTEEYIDGEKRLVLEKEPSLQILSGAGPNTEATWLNQGKEYGYKPFSYKQVGEKKNTGPDVFGINLQPSELESPHVNRAIKAANESLGANLNNLIQNTDYNSRFQLNNIRKQYYLVNRAEAVYAVGEFAEASNKSKWAKERQSFTQIKGKAKWGLQMGIDMKKPTFVYDLNTKKWHKYSRGSGRFNPIEGMPTRPPKIIAGLGNPGRETSSGKFIKDPQAVRAIEEFFAQNLNKTKFYAEKDTKATSSTGRTTFVDYGSKTNMKLSTFDQSFFKFRGKNFKTISGAYEAWKTGEYREGYTGLTGWQVNNKLKSEKGVKTIGRLRREELLSEIMAEKYDADMDFSNAVDRAGNIRVPSKDPLWGEHYTQMLESLKGRREAELEAKGEKIEFKERSILTEAEQVDLDKIKKNIKKLDDKVEKLSDELESNRDEFGEPIDLEIASEASGKLKEATAELDTFVLRERTLENKQEEYETELSYREQVKVHDEALLKAELADIPADDISMIQPGLKAEWFTRNHMPEELWTKGATSIEDVHSTRFKIIQQIEQIFQRHVEKGSKVNKVDQIINDIQKDMGVSLLGKNDAIAELRQWVTVFNQSVPVKHFRATPGRIMHMEEKSRQTSLSGLRKDMREPLKVIEEVHEEITGRKGESVYGILDHISRKEEGQYRDYELSRYRELDDIGKGKFNRELSAMIKYMGVKDTYTDAKGNRRKGGGGWYMYGGKGDNDRIIWMKHHPKMRWNRLNFEKQWNELSKMTSKIPDFKKYRDEAQSEFLKAFTSGSPKFKGLTKREAIESFKRSFWSNVMYDLALNRLEPTRANVELLLTNEGFIKNSTAFNKRAQIWFTNSYPGDKVAIAKELNKTYIDAEGVEQVGRGKQPLVENANGELGYQYVIARDLTKEVTEAMKKDGFYSWDAVRRTTELSENVDGAIIVTQEAVEGMNKDFGMPHSGQNKSFIIARNPKYTTRGDGTVASEAQGALLGKFMFHTAGPEMSRMMKEKGLHMIMQESAVKQLGTRKVGKYSIENGEINIHDSEINHLLPSEVKGNFSVKQSKHMLEDQAIPKQLFTALMPLSWEKIDPDVINDMYSSVIGERMKGDPIANENARKYLAARKDGALGTELVKEQNAILKDLDKLGIAETIGLLQANHSEQISAAVYQKILKQSLDLVKEEMRDKQYTEEEFNAEVLRWEEENDATGRHIKLALEWARDKRKQGMEASALGTMLHKYVRDYRMTAVKNYIVKSATRPKMANSLTSVMRPYDEGLRRDLDNANKWLKKLDEVGGKPIGKIKGNDIYADEIFFLDDKYKSRKIKTGISGIDNPKLTLGELWKKYEGKEYEAQPETKAAIEDFFNAVTVRVPMDSMSGAQVVHFKGFTGRDGHGILLHSRAMRAEGGADLDGDKSFVFFGGEKGMKPAWKDMYKSNKEEFYFETGSGKNKRRLVGDNKESRVPASVHKKQSLYRELLAKFIITKDTPANDKNRLAKARFNSKAYQYSPVERIRISQAAVDGRNQLGPAASSTQIMQAAFNAIMSVPEKQDKFRINVKGEKDFVKSAKAGKDVYKYREIELTVKPKETKDDMLHQRNLKRAMIGLASDPMDELGLKSKEKWFEYLWNAHFKVSDMKQIVKGRAVPIKAGQKFKIEKSLTANNLKKGVYGTFRDINDAYWGRNWSKGRKHSMEEIKELGVGAYSLAAKPEMLNSFLGKIGVDLAGLDWSDPIFNRVDLPQLTKLYTNFDKNVEDVKWMESLLGRSSLRSVMSDYIVRVKEHDLYTPDGLRHAAKTYKRFMSMIKGTPYANDVHGLRVAKEAGAQGTKKRKEMLSGLNMLAEDYLINDLTDMVTVEIVKDALQAGKEPDGQFYKATGMNFKEQVAEIFGHVEALKDLSWLKNKQRNQMKDMLTEIEENDPDWVNFESEVKSAVEKVYQETNNSEAKKMIKEINKKVSGQQSASLDQVEIDNRIRDYKTQLTPNGRRLYDHLMLGSLRKGNVQELENFLYSNKKVSRVTLDAMHSINMEAAKTSMSKLGFLSNAIDLVHSKEHIGAFNEKFSSTWERPMDKELKAVEKQSEKDLVAEKAKEVGIPVESETPDKNPIAKMFVKTGYEHLKEGKIDKEYSNVVSEIATILNGEGQYVKTKLNDFVRGVLNKDLNAMNKQDFIALRNYLVDIKTGSIWQQMFDKDGPTKVGKRHTMLFPRAINEELMRDEIQLMEKQGMYFDYSGRAQKGTMYTPTGYIGKLQNFIGRAMEEATNIGDEFVSDLKQRMLFLGDIPQAESLRQIAVAQRNGLQGELIAKEDKKAAMGYFKRRSDTEAAHNWPKLKKREFVVDTPDGRKRMTGEEVVKRINDAYTSYFREFHGFIKGNERALDDWTVTDMNIDKGEVPMVDVKSFLKHLETQWMSNKTDKAFWTNIGNDGVRRIARTIMAGMMKKDPKIRAAFLRQPHAETGTIKYEAYWPHMMFDRVEAKKAKEAELKKIMETPDSDMTQKQRNEALAKLMYKYKAVDGEWPTQDLEEWNVSEEIIKEISAKKKVKDDLIDYFNPDERSGAMNNRITHMEGWTMDEAAVDTYSRSTVQSFFKQLGQIFTKQTIEEMGRGMYKKWGPEQTEAWQTHAKLYAQDALGNPSNIPQKVYDNPVMKIKGTPYGWWADNRVRDRINKMMDKIGVTNMELPENMRGIDLQQVRHLSNLEAQFEMASLLAHPKSMMANIFGGTTHTVQSAGWKNFLDARNTKALMKINPEWKTMSDVDKFVIKQGVFPDFLIHDFGLSKEFQSSKNKSFIEEISRKLTRDPSLSEQSVREIAIKSNIPKKLMEFAAKFMSVPERAIRRDAFMAHYLQTWRKFGGAFERHDHPFLIEMAKKGVKATQFLYSATYRPAFARTALGKVMTRFQLWGWNAVRFRKDVMKEASIYGLVEGTASYEKFTRMAQIDIFVLALANMFAYSLFDNTLPAPWNWMQDTADLVFGDEQERNKAFFGAYPRPIAPLQVISPPILRMLAPSIRAMVDDDWSRVGEYHAWTMFPFGRMAKDVFGKNNIIDNPIGAMNKVTGIPLVGLHKEAQKRKDDEYDDDMLYPGSYKK